MMRILAIVLVLALSTMAKASDMLAPDLGDYYRSLMQPDNPVASCCGAADAYYADRVDTCGAKDYLADAECALVAIITDTRPDAITVHDETGAPKTLYRAPIEPGTRIAIPRHKLRLHPIANPTDHAIVFLSAARHVYCWEPGAGL